MKKDMLDTPTLMYYKQGIHYIDRDETHPETD